MANSSSFIRLTKNQMKKVVGGRKEMICTLGNGSTTNLVVNSPSDIGPTVDAWNAGYSNPQYQIVGCENPF